METSIKTQEELRQLSKDTQDSIKGKNNYNPHAGHLPEFYYPAPVHDDLPKADWHDNVLEII